ncbi:hypothetical protein AOQ84DRAFT_369971 [Glonium stellatum]|uniref:Uncharacterized protein n=1 Tax=Glonium stellatum TaxID=574774 RepID=A0A8E2ENB5_9PEZI|nr:hypothetical protein AOQ84DRAFT_369971 [Glonium stellatum]
MSSTPFSTASASTKSANTPSPPEQDRDIAIITGIVIGLPTLLFVAFLVYTIMRVYCIAGGRAEHARQRAKDDSWGPGGLDIETSALQTTRANPIASTHWNNASELTLVNSNPVAPPGLPYPSHAPRVSGFSGSNMPLELDPRTIVTTMNDNRLEDIELGTVL